MRLTKTKTTGKKNTGVVLQPTKRNEISQLSKNSAVSRGSGGFSLRGNFIFVLFLIFSLLFVQALSPQEEAGDITGETSVEEAVTEDSSRVETDMGAPQSEAEESEKNEEAAPEASAPDTENPVAEEEAPSSAPETEAGTGNAEDSSPQAEGSAGTETNRAAAAVGAAASAAAAAAEAASPKPEENAVNQEAENPEAQAEPPKPPNEKQLNTLRYGTETEIAALVQTLKNEKDSSLDSELVVLVDKSKNKTILSGIFSFFAEMEKPGLEERAVRVINERDDEEGETVLSAVNYLGRVKASPASPVLRELIDSGENRYLNAAIRALGRAGAGGQGTEIPDETAEFLLDYYDTGNPNNEDQREIIVALGENRSSMAASFLSDLIRNGEERVVLRMAALDAISKLGGGEGLDAVIEAVSASDPNVRSSAIAALGPFAGEDAEKAILDGFRDSYYRTRIGAAQAAGKRKMERAVQYLKFRAENDEVPAVKDEAIKALGAIANDEAVKTLGSLFSERKNSDRVRIIAGEMLLKVNAGEWASKVIVELDDAKLKNQTALYNGFLRILGPSVSPSLESLAKRFFASGTVIEKSYALDMILNNGFTGMAADLRLLLDEKKNGAGLARKAGTTLEKLGLPLSETQVNEVQAEAPQ